MAYDSDDPVVGAPRGVVDTSRGVWAFTADVDLLRRLARGGFDWVALDAQHGPVDRAVLHAVGRAFSDTGAAFVVRVPAVDPGWIGAALDAGAAAVVVPSVTGSADAALAARSSRYPPEGDRSWGPFAPQWGGTTRGRCTVRRPLMTPVWGGMRVCGASSENIASGAFPGMRMSGSAASAAAVRGQRARCASMAWPWRWKW